MNWKTIRNNQSINIKDISLNEISSIRKEIIEQVNSGKRLISFYGNKSGNQIILYIVLADDENSRLFVTSAIFDKDASYQSFTQDLPAFNFFEREFFEEFGIKPIGHPWLKPVRYNHDRFDQGQKIENYPFYKMIGKEIHEVAVGPVHAGIIEPGHFRFMCHGENVYHLEIQMGYQHRGIEKLFLNKEVRFLPLIAESIAGDTVIGHSASCSRLLEALGNSTVSNKALSIRAISLELERIAVHIGDLCAIAGDVAYLIGNAAFGTTRTLAINSTLSICGSRFGRGLIRCGGVMFDIDKNQSQNLISNLDKINHDMELMAETMFSSSSVLSRLDQTGIVDTETAKKIGMVGPAARASGVSVDVRTDHPFGMYRNYPYHKLTLDSGDVFARVYIRYIEIKQSIKFILEQLENFPVEGKLQTPFGNLAPDSFAVSMTEGWRGEIVHSAITDQTGDIIRYKIKDPSFNNWYGLALAVRNNGISDFPLCNKSFNLSYCGFDL